MSGPSGFCRRSTRASALHACAGPMLRPRAGGGRLAAMNPHRPVFDIYVVSGTGLWVWVARVGVGEGRCGAVWARVCVCWGLR
jgi:hypothetical protein